MSSRNCYTHTRRTRYNRAAIEYLYSLVQLAHALNLDYTGLEHSEFRDRSWIDQLYACRSDLGLNPKAYLQRDIFWIYFESPDLQIDHQVTELNLMDDIVLILQQYRRYNLRAEACSEHASNLTDRGQTVKDDLEYHRPVVEETYHQLHQTCLRYGQQASELQRALQSAIDRLEALFTRLMDQVDNYDGADSSYDRVIGAFLSAPTTATGRLPRLLTLREQLKLYRPPLKGSCTRRLAHLLREFENGTAGHPGLSRLERRLAAAETDYLAAIVAAEHEFRVLAHR